LGRGGRGSVPRLVSQGRMNWSFSSSTIEEPLTLGPVR
jgi:hypothetical protein